MSCECCGNKKLRQFKKVCEIIDSHDRKPANLIPILHGIQKEYRYLPEEILTYVAMSLGIPPAKVYGVASFYAHFSLEPKGKYVVHLCDGTACHVKGSMKIFDALKKKLSLSKEQHTTEDMLFTVETVSCLGACGMAPVMTINDKVYGQVTPEKAVEAVTEILEKEQQ